MRDGREPGCTATRTATPTNISNIEQSAVNNGTRKEARGAHRRTSANKPRRIPYALPHKNFDPHSRLKHCYKRLEPMYDGQRDGLYSNGHATLPYSESPCAFSVS